MKKVLIAVILLLNFKSVVAQQGDLTYFNYKGKDIINFLITRVNYPRKMVDSCSMPFTYVKFKINSQNAVDSLGLTNDKFPELKAELVKNLALTKGYWKLKEINNRWLVIPMMFFMISDRPPRKGCDYPAIIEKQSNYAQITYFPKDCIYLPVLAVKIYTSEKILR